MKCQPVFLQVGVSLEGSQAIQHSIPSWKYNDQNALCPPFMTGFHRQMKIPELLSQTCIGPCPEYSTTKISNRANHIHDLELLERFNIYNTIYTIIYTIYTKFINNLF